MALLQDLWAAITSRALPTGAIAGSLAKIQRQLFLEPTAAPPVANSMADRIIAGAGGVASIFAGFGYPGLGFGDGSDGARTVSANTEDPAATILSQYTTLVIDATRVLTINAANNYRIILATTSITVNGEINVDGRGAPGTVGSVNAAQGGDGGTVSATAVPWSAAGGGGSSPSGLGGGAGGAGGSVGAAATATSALKLARARLIFGPGGLSGGPAIHPSLWTMLNDFGAGGGGGIGATGGNGGGTLLLAAPTITVGASGIISARGTQGTSGTQDAGGGGGGRITLIYTTLTNSGTIRVTGGLNGAGAASGADGLIIYIPTS